MEKIQHPLEIKAFLTKNRNGTKTLSVESYLSAAEEKTDKNGYVQAPLNIFAKYSVYRFAIIEKKETYRNIIIGNIPLSVLPTLEKKTLFCSNKIMELQEKILEGIEEQTMVYLKVGKFKNKTPEQVLLENPQNRVDLENTMNWLKDRISMHPNNEVQYNAIVHALNKLERNELNTVNNQSQHTYEIYNADIRTLESCKRDDGKILVYSLQITCTPGKEYPYQINITNFYAYCNGIMPKEGTVSDTVRTFMVLSETDWNELIEHMRTVKQIYVQTYGNYELKRAITAFEEISGKKAIT